MDDALYTPHGVLAHLGRLLNGLCRAMAILGGVVLSLMALMSVISIVGRWLGGLEWVMTQPALAWIGAVPGDYELVEMGAAIAVFCFFPYCHLTNGHVTVDVFVMRSGPRLKAALHMLANLLFFITAAVLTWRLWHGMLDKLEYGETSMLLRLPLWWGYSVGVAAFALLTLTCLFQIALACGALVRQRTPRRDQTRLPHRDAAQHQPIGEPRS
ncbi:TRAP transporter small permease [Phytohalomonas tamaricis]|uniref:TRAP transporter small permease n=1 Tax=Phytohalomonas tamaricis TaxID=2081032 RepID=UPI000D0BD9A4|nr:TRAP transporter small permease [Phytohalomonas tamaricis]